MRAKAIETLGALDASDELKQLFDTTQDAQTGARSSSALGVAGNTHGAGCDRRKRQAARSDAQSMRCMRSASPATEAASRRW